MSPSISFAVRTESFRAWDRVAFTCWSLRVSTASGVP